VDDFGAARRPSRQKFDREIDEVLARHGPHGEVFDSLAADVDKVRAYLDSDLDPAAHGVVIVACSALDIFEPVALSLPVPDRIDVGPIPALSVLVQMYDDHPTYAVLLADQKDATLAIISLATLGRTVSIEGTDFPRHQQQGGWSQRRYQMRADERVAAFVRAVAEQTRTLLDEEQIPLLVLAGEEVNTAALMDEFHQTVRNRVAGIVRMDIRASDSDLIEATLPIIDESERRREHELVQQLADSIGSGGPAAANLEETLEALQLGQVDTLVMADDLHAAGWADYELNVFGTGLTPSQHPTGGDADSIVPVSLEQEMIRLALGTGADIEIVQSATTVHASNLEKIPEAGALAPRSDAARQLDDFGAVGALLRFAVIENSHPEGAAGA
jgi:peptide subunit release factor 1 (eRF1)